MHRKRDSRGRFIARRKSSIFTIPTTSRNRQDTPPSQTHTPSLRIPRIQGVAAKLEDSPTSSTKTDLGEELLFTSIGQPIAIEEVELPRKEDEVETLSH